jgi:nucleoside-diphosphate-sugar epimerase
MTSTEANGVLIGPDDLILVTGASGFIGRHVVERLLERGFRRIRCLVRPSSESKARNLLAATANLETVEIFHGNLLSREDCVAIAKDAAAVIHLAAGRGEKSFPDAFMNSAVTTRNLLDACVQHGVCRRFVNVSSFAVYDNGHKTTGRVLDESCPLEVHPEVRGEAYCFAKTKQEQVTASYRDKFGLSVVTIRPGVVYGPGNLAISGRVGIDTFGVFLHMGGSNRIPLTYVDNCADAIVLGAVSPLEGSEAFNVVDDKVPTSREFLKLYKKTVREFRSVYLPKPVSYTLCYLWEKYCEWSQGQLPSAFNRNRWNSLWRKTEYDNTKLKKQLGWSPLVSTEEGLRRYFAACRETKARA